MGRKILAGLMLCALAALPASRALACSCARFSTLGFLGTSSRPGENAVLRLPADAKGVLFDQPMSFPTLEMGKEGTVIGTLPAELKAADFTVTDEAGGAALPVVLTRLRLPFRDAGWPAPRFFRLRSKEKAACLREGAGEACRVFQRFRYDHQDWMGQLLAKGELEEVTAAVERSFGLFRVGPKGGFKPGREYAVARAGGGERVKVRVDKEPAGPLLARGFALEPEGAQAASMLPVSAGGSCSQTIPARVQRLAYAVPAGLEGYKDSLLFFLAYPGGEGLTQWVYRSNVCASSRLGRSEAGFAKDLVYAACADALYGPGLRRGTPYEFAGFAGMLEVEDELRPTNKLPVSFELGACDVNSIVSQAGTPGSRVDSICLLARTSEPDPAKMAALFPTLSELASGADGRGRSCAMQVLKGLPYRFQRGELGEAAQRQAASLLAGALRDSQAEVRISAAEGLRDFARVPKLPAASVPEAVAALSRALGDAENGVRVPAGEALAALGTAAKAATGALIAALKDPDKPNYAVPPALAAIAPEDPRVPAAIREALKHKDSIVRMTAAQALGTLGAAASGAASVPDLMAAARENNGDAVNALGRLGPRAKEAAPLLVELARTAKWPYMRQYAMEALAAIAPEDPGTLAAVAAALREAPQPNEYTRQKALEALGKMGPAARPAVGDMLAVLERNPTEYETGTLVRSLIRIGPPLAQIQPALMRLMGHKTRYIREETGRYLAKAAPRDGAVLARLLADDEAGVVHEGLRALVSLKPGEEITHRPQVLKALAAVIKDDSRYDDTRHYAYTAAERIAAGDPGVCAALAHRRDAEKLPFNQDRVERIRRRLCE